eukprot:Protomagalhaensia_sp_Gyna_25__1513@NODE_1777_length_1545_cov_2_782869_g1456_i0_p1_GENE_NODE_1777_length_1545_cov_2_782869_g1456_i0NODE_1777_length_1545_cov_2_782869_g1456_i0_p1_ORF_typecomplete_len290_score38_02_NODE_1777_length_1545_cov_2_782869_g1456_i038907
MSEVGVLWKCLLCGTVFVDTAVCDHSPAAGIDYDKIAHEIFEETVNEVCVKLLPCPTCVEIGLRQPYQRVVDEALIQTRSQILTTDRAGAPLKNRPHSAGIVENSDNLTLLLFPCKPLLISGLPLLYRTRFQSANKDTHQRLWQRTFNQGPEELELSQTSSSGFKLDPLKIKPFLDSLNEPVSALAAFDFEVTGSLEQALKVVDIDAPVFDRVSHIVSQIGLNELVPEGYFDPNSTARKKNSDILKFYGKSDWMRIPLFGTGGVDIRAVVSAVETLKAQVMENAGPLEP